MVRGAVGALPGLRQAGTARVPLLVLEDHTPEGAAMLLNLVIGLVIVLVPAGQGTRVTWGFDTDLGNNPVQRYFGLMLERFLGPQYEQGLADLKALVET